jgi:hypothetical protein
MRERAGCDDDVDDVATSEQVQKTAVGEVFA